MNNYLSGAASASAILLGCAAGAQAEGDPRFIYEAEIEIGVDSVVSSDDPLGEVTNAFATAEVAVEYAVTQVVSVFAALTLESVTDPMDDRAFEDMGLYISDLGVNLTFDQVTLTFGKFAPSFGLAWDLAPGYFGTAFAEDYELSEMIGVGATFALGAGNLSAAVFYQDDSVLSRSWGTDRGRNTVAAGGVGNTGELNNVALHYALETNDTLYTASASLLSAGIGDVEDQKGLTFGLVHALNDQVALIGEIAAFDGYGGTADSANYLTLGGAYSQGAYTYAASYTRRDVSRAPVDHLISLGLDYTFQNDITLSSGYAYAKEAGVGSHNLGLSVIIPFGG